MINVLGLFGVISRKKANELFRLLVETNVRIECAEERADAAEQRAEKLVNELWEATTQARVARTAATLAKGSLAVERIKRERSERELERWRLRLRDRARRRKEETEGVGVGADWLASRARAQAARGSRYAGRRGMLPPFPVGVMAHLREPVSLPMSDAERQAICDRLGIDVSAWAQQIRDRALVAMRKLEKDGER